MLLQPMGQPSHYMPPPPPPRFYCVHHNLLSIIEQSCEASVHLLNLREARQEHEHCPPQPQAGPTPGASPGTWGMGRGWKEM